MTNDDGVTAPGIAALAEALEALDAVVVVAPDLNRSGESHKHLASSIASRPQQHRPRWWSTDGTPTDCVYLSVIELLPRRPDLVVSGINAGPNLSHDVHVPRAPSPRPSRARSSEISSIAVSLVDTTNGSHALAAQFTKNLAARVLARGGLPIGTTLNVNVPPGAPTRHQMTYLGHRSYRQLDRHAPIPAAASDHWIRRHARSARAPRGQRLQRRRPRRHLGDPADD